MNYKTEELTLNSFWSMELRRLADALDAGTITPLDSASGINDALCTCTFAWREN